ncbi:MAG: NAD-dependent DNA ligase LigA [Zetaproteobacteria bacterium]|nr:NAD-dependent DNA ligase LigA [Zetaproteobacteria bacterium]
MNSKSTSIDQIDYLVQEIIYHREQYTHGNATLSDADYDQLEDQLRTLSPEHPILQQVGSKPSSGLEKVEHTTPMLSLKKVYNLQEMEAWRKNLAVVGAYKIDGNSMSLIYSYGTFTIAKTRGDGKTGEDVTSKLHWVLARKNLLKLPMLQEAPYTEIRGELYCTKNGFKLLSTEMQRLNLDPPTSERNIVAGVLTRKSHASLARFFDFFSFDVLSQELNIATEEDKVNWLTEAGFTPPPSRLLKSPEACKSFIEEAQAFKENPKREYEIDGAVMTINHTQLHTEMGATSHHPRYRLAFKWQSYATSTQLKSIEWNTSRSGLVIPVGILTPVHMPPGNAKISRLSLHNAGVVVKKNLKPGSQVKIVRAGDIIPHLQENLHTTFGPPQIPTRCPSCQTDLLFQEEGQTGRKSEGNSFLQLYCPNSSSCPNQLLKTLRHWCSTLDIADLGEQRLEHFIRAGLVRCTGDLYQLESEQIARLEGYQMTIAHKIVTNIQASKGCSTALFLAALGIPGLGKELAVGIQHHYQGTHKFLHLASTQQEALSQVELAPGRTVGAKRAQTILNTLKQKRNDFLALENLIKPKYIPPAQTLSTISPMTEFTLVISGTFSCSRNLMTKYLQSLGATISSSMTQSTNLLLISDKSSQSSKAKKARASETCQIWDEQDLIRYLKKHEVDTSTAPFQ